MDLKNDLLSYENKYLGDVNNFGISIQLIIAEEGTPADFPVQIQEGDTAIVLNIFDNNEKTAMSCVFIDFGDTVLFLEGYLTRCKNIADAILAYKNFLFSETAIHLKKYVS